MEKQILITSEDINNIIWKMLVLVSKIESFIYDLVSRNYVQVFLTENDNIYYILINGYKIYFSAYFEEKELKSGICLVDYYSMKSVSTLLSNKDFYISLYEKVMLYKQLKDTLNSLNLFVQELNDSILEILNLKVTEGE